MAGLGKALNSLGKTTVLGKTPHETDPNRDTTVGGFFNSHLPYLGNYGPQDRYHFPSHTRERPITGPTAGHGIEGEILRRVAQHPSDPFGLKAVGIDNQAWEPEVVDIHDMAYVEWASGRSVYSEIERAGGFLDQFGLRDGVAGGGGQGGSEELERLRSEVAKLKEQLRTTQNPWMELKLQVEAVRAALAEVKITSAGGKPMGALRKIQKIVG